MRWIGHKGPIGPTGRPSLVERAHDVSFYIAIKLLLKEMDLALNLAVDLDLMFDDLRGIECRRMVPVDRLADIFKGCIGIVAAEIDVNASRVRMDFFP